MTGQLSDHHVMQRAGRCRRLVARKDPFHWGFVKVVLSSNKFSLK